MVATEAILRTAAPAAAGPGGRGFSLVELLIAIALIGILLGMAAPAFTGMIAGQRVRSAAGDVHGALLLARSEAMKRNAGVALTASDAADWSRGWAITIAGGDILKQEALGNGIQIEGPASGTVSFLWTGRPATASGNASFRVRSSTAGVPARCVVLSLSGMPEGKPCPE